MDELKTNSQNKHTLIMMPSGRRGQIPEGMTLLDAAESMGVQIESICGGRQTCGKCHVLVEEGYYDKHGIRSLPGHLSSPPRGKKHSCWKKWKSPTSAWLALPGCMATC